VLAGQARWAQVRDADPVRGRRIVLDAVQDAAALT
jgi:hypothetical protein